MTPVYKPIAHMSMTHSRSQGTQPLIIRFRYGRMELTERLANDWHYNLGVVAPVTVISLSATADGSL